MNSDLRGQETRGKENEEKRKRKISRAIIIWILYNSIHKNIHLHFRNPRIFKVLEFATVASMAFTH